ncbi:MAG TPA: protealysin inhibitor emfourin [Anaerolineales bacterium]|jgi:hypothetical protein
MKISFERSGGFAGLVMSVDLDLDELPADEAAYWTKLVDEADLANISTPTERPGYADGFQYTIKVVVEENEEYEVQLNEGYIPENLVTLVNDLTLRARYHRE